MESSLQMEYIKRNSKQNSVSGKRPLSPMLSGKLSLATIEDVSNDIHKMFFINISSLLEFSFLKEKIFVRGEVNLIVFTAYIKYLKSLTIFYC